MEGEALILTGTEQWEYRSEDYGRTYSITAAVPNQDPPPAGFPVLYVLDGDALFLSLQEMARLQARRSRKTRVPPMLIIGIGYPGSDGFHPRRFYDFTPPEEKRTLPPKPDGKPWPDSGGGAEFLDILESGIKPAVLGKYRVNPNKQMIFGHSLGGLFALYTLFSKPESFSGYIACSPSIWWNEQSVLGQEAGFLKRIEEKDGSIPLFLAAGSEEKDYLVEDAAELYRRLSGCAGIKPAFRIAEGENHMSVVHTVFSAALRHMFA